MKQTRSIGRSVKVTFDIEKLLDIRAEMKKRYAARVGVLGQKNGRSSGEQGNADIGMVHEFGSLSRHIPRRSFLEMPLALKMPEYAATFGASLMKAIDEGNLRPAFVKLGIKGEQVVQMAFASGGFGVWPALKLSTLYRKHPKGFSRFTKEHNDQILIDTGQLRRSITSDVVTK